jgi:hypothetical protein
MALARLLPRPLLSPMCLHPATLCRVAGRPTFHGKPGLLTRGLASVAKPPAEDNEESPTVADFHARPLPGPPFIEHCLRGAGQVEPRVGLHQASL